MPLAKDTIAAKGLDPAAQKAILLAAATPVASPVAKAIAASSATRSTAPSATTKTLAPASSGKDAALVAHAAAAAAAAAAATPADTSAAPAIQPLPLSQRSEALQAPVEAGTVTGAPLPTTIAQGGDGGGVAGTGSQDPTSEDWPDPEAGDAGFTVADLAALEGEADAYDADAERTLAAVSHPRPGTIIGTPYVGTHSRATNCEPPPGPSCNWESMNAVDVWLYPGTHLLAVLDGVISPGGWGYGRSAYGGRFAGIRLHLVTPSGLIFYYTHMQGIAVAKGQRVKKGQLVGYSGVANGVSHLHFAVNPPANPAAYVAAAYNVHARTPAPTDPLGQPVTGQAKPAHPAGVFANWRALVNFYKTTVPKRHAAVKSVGDSLKEVLR